MSRSLNFAFKYIEKIVRWSRVSQCTIWDIFWGAGRIEHQQPPVYKNYTSEISWYRFRTVPAGHRVPLTAKALLIATEKLPPLYQLLNSLMRRFHESTSDNCIYHSSVDSPAISGKNSEIGCFKPIDLLFHCQITSFDVIKHQSKSNVAIKVQHLPKIYQ